VGVISEFIIEGDVVLVGFARGYLTEGSQSIELSVANSKTVEVIGPEVIVSAASAAAPLTSSWLVARNVPW